MSLRVVVLLMLCLCWLPPAGAAQPAILVLGDSLSAGYGLDAGQGWVALLEQKLRDEGIDRAVINASVSGDTTAGGRARLPDLLARHRPGVVLIELGGNDGLRALPVERMQDNLLAMADASRAAGARVLLFEMRIPDNYGPLYADRFAAAFAAVADQRRLPLVPFFLAAFAEDASAFQDDGIHPGAAVQPRMLDAVWPRLLPLIRP